MPSAHDTPTLQGVRLHVPDAEAAAALLGQLLGRPRDGERACVHLGSTWLAFDTAAGSEAGRTDATPLATLHWGCQDLTRQRLLLAQLGIDALEDSVAAEDGLRVTAGDTGACALAWKSRRTARDGGDRALPRLRALVLSTRTPERAAAHWAQMFRTRVAREASGTPRLELDGVSLRFAFSEGVAGGVSALTLMVADAVEASARAIALGLAQRPGDDVAFAGLTLQLVPTGND